MGQQWLNEVLAALRTAGWRAEPGYPGPGASMPETPVAAVNLCSFDTRQSSTGITVSVLVPGGIGLAQCQAAAVQAAELLGTVGGEWSFAGWQYDGRLDCFRVDLEGNQQFSTPVGRSYEVLIGENLQDWVTEFTAKKDMQRRLYRPHGQTTPVGITAPICGWTIELVQRIPFGSPEPEETADQFALTVRSGASGMKYLDCCWGEYESRQCEDGIRVCRRGFALEREAV